jgi:hypothetical protein
MTAITRYRQLRTVTDSHPPLPMTAIVIADVGHRGTKHWPYTTTFIGAAAETVADGTADEGADDDVADGTANDAADDVGAADDGADDAADDAADLPPMAIYKGPEPMTAINLYRYLPTVTDSYPPLPMTAIVVADVWHRGTIHRPYTSAFVCAASETAADGTFDDAADDNNGAADDGADGAADDAADLPPMAIYKGPASMTAINRYRKLPTVTDSYPPFAMPAIVVADVGHRGTIHWPYTPAFVGAAAETAADGTADVAADDDGAADDGADGAADDAADAPPMDIFKGPALVTAAADDVADSPPMAIYRGPAPMTAINRYRHLPTVTNSYPPLPMTAIVVADVGHRGTMHWPYTPAVVGAAAETAADGTSAMLPTTTVLPTTAPTALRTTPLIYRRWLSTKDPRL